MKFVLLSVAQVALTINVQALASVELKAPQTQAGTYADTYARQGVGRVEVSSDGRFLVYEWGRPYLGWAPETSWIAPGAARRLQTFLYKVDLTQESPTSEYLFYPSPGCTYWLGGLSPDNKKLIVFELSHDLRTVRAGVLSVEGSKNIQWFSPRVDERKLGEMAMWVSNSEFVYPVIDAGSSFVQVSLLTNNIQACGSCNTSMINALHENTVSAIAGGKAAASRIDARDLPAGVQLLAGATNGSLAVFVRDTADVLSLLAKKPDQPARIIFENPRKWPKSETSK